MIKLNKLNDEEFYLNCEQIEKIECHPDTTVTMMNGHVYIVNNSIDELLDKVIKYKRKFVYLAKREDD